MKNAFDKLAVFFGNKQILAVRIWTIPVYNWTTHRKHDF